MFNKFMYVDSILRMKLHYVFYLSSIACIVGFSPTIAKQLGYSPMFVGYLYTYLSVITFLVKTICGIIVDKFPIKKIIFAIFILGSGLSAFALNFAEKLPTEAVVDLTCDKKTFLNICQKNESHPSQCDDNLPKRFTNTEHVECQLFCRYNELFWSEICESWNITDYCTTANNTFKNNNLGFLNTSLLIYSDKAKKSYIFQIESVQINETQVILPICRKLATTQCDIFCTNDLIMELVNTPKSDILHLHQFWEYFIVMSLFWISQSVIWCLQDSICFDVLGDKPEDYGKLRCWGSISWGISSILGGILVDYVSKNNYQKNYVPIFYICLAVMLLDFILVFKIKVTETVASKNTFSDIFKLVTKLNIIVYFIWIIVMGIFTSMIWNYLFWYMEDITNVYQSDKLPWIKTLQGLAIGIQCVLGEMPFLFFSGWVIKRIGHLHCMSLGLFVFAIRFYLYSIITNPIWILPVELANGITFGLCNAVLMTYARKIAPASAVTTIQSFSGGLYEGVGVSIGGIIGGFLYENYGGVQTFKFFSYSALLLGIFHVLFIRYLNK